MKLNRSDLSRENKLNKWCWCTTCFSGILPRVIHGRIAKYMGRHKEYYQSKMSGIHNNDICATSTNSIKRVKNNLKKIYDTK